MTIVKEHFEELCFMNSKIRKFEVVDRNLVVYINYGVEIFPDHPLCDVHKFTDPCIFIFENIKILKLEIYEYINDGNGFKEKRVIENKLNDFIDREIEYDDYYIEGVLEKPHAWMSGDIIAEIFMFNDLKQ